MSLDALTEVDTFSHEGATFHVFREELKDGRIHLYFTPSLDALKGVDRRGRETTRVGYRVYGNEAILLGLMVPPSMAGHHMGEALIKYFVERLDKEGLTFIGTGKINKPMIAQTLVRAGFEPVSRNVLVEILPKRASDESRVPNVQVVKNEQKAKLVTGASGGPFYRVISPEEALRVYPISGPDTIVAIQTRYILPGQEATEEP